MNSDMQVGALLGITVGIMFSLIMVALIVGNPGPTMVEHCEYILEVEDE